MLSRRGNVPLFSKLILIPGYHEKGSKEHGWVGISIVGYMPKSCMAGSYGKTVSTFSGKGRNSNSTQGTFGNQWFLGGVETVSFKHRTFDRLTGLQWMDPHWTIFGHKLDSKGHICMDILEYNKLGVNNWGAGRAEEINRSNYILWK